MGGKEMKALPERYLEAYNAFDVEGMLALVDPNVEFKNVSGGACPPRRGASRRCALSRRNPGRCSRREDRP
jgi:hypothetical protein